MKNEKYKRKAIGIIYENHKTVIAPSNEYGIDKNGSVRLKHGRQRLTKGMREELRKKNAKRK